MEIGRPYSVAIGRANWHKLRWLAKAMKKEDETWTPERLAEFVLHDYMQRNYPDLHAVWEQRERLEDAAIKAAARKGASQ